MKVTVVCFGALRDYLPAHAVDNRAGLEVDEEATTATVGASLAIPQGLVFAVLVNGEQRPVDAGLEEDDEVTLMPPFAGGQGCPPSSIVRSSR